MIDHLWLVRHGVTESNRDRIVQGQRDVTLSDEGREQARKLGEFLAAKEVGFDSVLASDLQRARETAEILAAAVGFDGDLLTDGRLREVDYGEWQGLGYDEVGEASTRDGRERFAVRAPGGESILDMGERVLGCLDEWMSREDLQGRMLLVSHGGPVQAILSRAMGLALDYETSVRWLRDNTGYSILRRRRREPDQFAVVTVNAAPHLL